MIMPLPPILRPLPMVLVILDGWGIGPATDDNAIYVGKTPHFDRWWQEQPHALVRTSEGDVGLPKGQMGNSEVGHLNIGAGRIVYQDYTRIDRAIADGSFYHNVALVEAIQTAQKKQTAVHIMGLLSPGGVHSHYDHLLAAVQLAGDMGVEKVYLHAFLDGRDTPPRSARAYVATVENKLSNLQLGRIVSLCGRYWAMDRDKRWDRVERAYNMLTMGEGLNARSADEAIVAAYARGENDEFVQPTCIGQAVTVADGDVVLMMNFRADRARELGHAFTDARDVFQGFSRKKHLQLSHYVTLTQHDETLTGVGIAFLPVTLQGIMGEEIARLGWSQLRAAETEKYAHVTFFLNGGREEPFAGEDRLLIPSPKVATYDLKPSMAAVELTEAIIARLRAKRYDWVVINYANPDMVGHTGILSAAIAAVECVDACLGRLWETVCALGGEIVITADHGNVEQMRELHGQTPHTAHTTRPAPLIYLGKQSVMLRDGRLCDIAPTLLALMGRPPTPEMEGVSLLATLPDINTL